MTFSLDARQARRATVLGLTGLLALSACQTRSPVRPLPVEVDGPAARQHQVAVIVRDTGCGIPPGQLEAIFESFYTGKPDGLGIGLSLLKRFSRRS